MLRQLSPLYKDKRNSYQCEEDNYCVLRSQPVEATGSLEVYPTGSSNPTEPAIARKKSGAVSLFAKLPTNNDYVPTVHFLLHYFPIFLCIVSSCFQTVRVQPSQVMGVADYIRHYDNNHYMKGYTKCQVWN